MWFFNFLKKKNIRKTYKFLVSFSIPKDEPKKVGLPNCSDAIFYWKTKGEIVQTIRNSEKYIWYKILSIKLE
jgi:hypothetical protein